MKLDDIDMKDLSEGERLILGRALADMKSYREHKREEEEKREATNQAVADWFWHQVRRFRDCVERLWSWGKTEHQLRVEEMMRRTGKQVVPSQPCVPSFAVRLARAKLVLEEAFELTEALGLKPYVILGHHPDPEDLTSLADGIWVSVYLKRLTFRPTERCSLPEIAKEAVDVSVVTIGTLSACGVSDRPLLKAVDDNNLAKFGPGGYLDENGKWQKPPGHQKPDIGRLLEAQGWVPSNDEEL